DELHSLSESSSDVEDFARTVLAWLASPEFDVAKQLGGVPEGAKCDFGDHYRECRFRLDGRFVRLSAISVDSSSLLAKDSGHSRAGALFQQIVERCRDDAMARPEDCPIRANLQQWMSSSAIQNWEKVL